ncbi:hypothetical protein HUJ05_003367 [Dendroctonus ponderosae]|nr:hypothetical protein HUJ05_003367 [Dendroctonus ponderosae]
MSDHRDIDPNGGAVPNTPAAGQKSPPQNENEIPTLPYWESYDTINQFYLEMGKQRRSPLRIYGLVTNSSQIKDRRKVPSGSRMKRVTNENMGQIMTVKRNILGWGKFHIIESKGSRPEIKNHYRGHKMSLWLNLIPQLHRPGDGDDVSMRHHHFQEEDDEYYDGSVRPQLKERPTYVHQSPPPVTVKKPPLTTTMPTPPPPKSDTALQATTTECPPNTTIIMQTKNPNNLLRLIEETSDALI